MRRLPRHGSNRTVIAAPPEAVWAVIADPTRVGEWSHETMHAFWEPPHSEAVPGATFVGRNRMGPMRWTRRSEVLAVDPGHSIAWRTVPTRRYRDSTRWTLRVEPTAGGTLLIQDFEILQIHPVLDRLFYLLLRPHRDRSGALTTDLDRIGELAVGRVAG